MSACGLPPEKRLSWLASILPFVEQEPTFRILNPALAWDAEENRPCLGIMPLYMCAGHPTVGTTNHTHYVGLAGVGADAADLGKDHPAAGFFGYSRRIKKEDVKDGLGCTIAVLETAVDNGPWAAGGHTTVRSLGLDENSYVGEGRPFGIKHRSDTFFRSNPIMANTLFGDGSVRSVPGEISPHILRSLVTIAGNEQVEVDF